MYLPAPSLFTCVCGGGLRIIPWHLNEACPNQADPALRALNTAGIPMHSPMSERPPHQSVSASPLHHLLPNIRWFRLFACGET